MANEIAKWQPPTLAELTTDIEKAAQNDVLNIALNLEPPPSWVKENEFVKVKVNGKSELLKYIPIDKQRLIAKRIFGIVKVEILREAVMFHSICVTVRLHYTHPLTGQELFMDGIGAVAVQTDSGSSASDLSKIKNDSVMKAAPAAATYAEKNAYDKIGRVFGGEIQKDAIQYNADMSSFAKEFYGEKPTDEDWKDLSELLNLKTDSLSPTELTDAQRIISKKESNSFKKLQTLFKNK